jgi:hypothetical protein
MGPLKELSLVVAMEEFDTRLELCWSLLRVASPPSMAVFITNLLFRINVSEKQCCLR